MMQPAQRRRGHQTWLLGLLAPVLVLMLSFSGLLHNAYTLTRDDKDNCMKTEQDFSACLNKKIVGREPLKEKLIEQYRLAQQHQKMRRSGGKTPPLHFALTGNPGTGKTMVARLLGDIFKQFGLLATGAVKEFQRGDLVSDDRGRTTHTIIKDRIAEAEGGICFIDEAERLVNNPNPSGRDALEEIMALLGEAKNVMVIFAGYSEGMRELYRINEGLERRIHMEIHLDDYKPEELARIFIDKASSFFIIPDTAEKDLTDMFNRKFIRHIIRFYNAGLIDHLLNDVASEIERKERADSKAATKPLETEDLEKAFDKLQKRLEERQNWLQKKFH